VDPARGVTAIADLRDRVAAAHVAIAEAGLVTLSFGNVSAIDRDAGLIAIKPSGIPCRSLTGRDVVLVALDDGRVVDGALRPSTDTPTHRRLYLDFPSVGAVVHTHSPRATAWAQAGRSIPCLGTTHADYFRGPVPVSRPMLPDEIIGAYEWETGALIVDTVRTGDTTVAEASAVLIRSHGPFTWGPTPEAAVEVAIALEAIAAMALDTTAIDPAVEPIPDVLLDRHFGRKHGAGAYYGQGHGGEPGRQRMERAG
jgi:L-ribulose-5-phosphate 4-epimerase